MLLNLKEILQPAHEHFFALPAFNIGTGQILNGVMDQCEAMQAPVILAIHPLELDFQGDSFLKMCIDRAYRSPIPVCIHLDHAGWEPILRALRAGFTSVMIDASALPFEENIALTKRVVDLAHPMGVSVEGELGTIGSIQGDEVHDKDIIYTDPDDAERFVEATGVDALAVAIGTAHGKYPANFHPQLQLNLLQEIKSKAKLPLVLHGGSGNPDDEVARAVDLGINKINISTDIKEAFYQMTRKTLQDPNIREPFDIYPASVEAMQKVVADKVRLFRCADKAHYY